MIPDYLCDWCLRYFTPVNSKQKYCNRQHAKRASERRRLEKKMAEGSYKEHSKLNERELRWRQIVALRKRDDNKCQICGLTVSTNKASPYKATVGHIIPVSHGGSDKLENLQLEHSKCNNEKGNSCPGCDYCLQPLPQESL